MVPTFSQPFGAGDLRIGIASWDKGDFKSRSIKYAYRDRSGKVSRGCPELPFDVLVEMMIVALKQKELSIEQMERVKYHLR
jgi:hypothetical protein